MLELTNARGDRVQVAAERGGKITSLRGAGGREWLAQTELLDRSPSGLDFVAAAMSGWDECAPSIDPGELDGVRFSDHGDLWDRSWTVLDAAEVIEFCREAVALARREPDMAADQIILRLIGSES